VVGFSANAGRDSSIIAGYSIYSCMVQDGLEGMFITSPRV
jgi:hypothetical protein